MTRGAASFMETSLCSTRVSWISLMIHPNAKAHFRFIHIYPSRWWSEL
jgi:hypothetical protein